MHTTNKGDRKQWSLIRTGIPSRWMPGAKASTTSGEHHYSGGPKTGPHLGEKKWGHKERPLPLIFGQLIASRLGISPRRDEFGTTAPVADCDHLTTIVPVIPASR